MEYKIINDDINNKKRLKIPYKKIRNITKDLSPDTEVLISSYEFCYDIERKLKKRYFFIDYFKFYNGYSRDILNSFIKWVVMSCLKFNIFRYLIKLIFNIA